MTQRKICMLGSFGVGKTSLVRRFVHDSFDETYHTTVGVKIDRKQLEVEGTSCTLMLWDIHGEDEFKSIRLSYLRGAGGYLLVADGTRRETLERALALQEIAEKTTGTVPFGLVVNKTDLEADWAVTEADLDEARARGWSVHRTSAKTGADVAEAFVGLAARMLDA